MPWWGWLVAAGVLWLLQLAIPDENRNLRMVLIIGMALSALIGIIRFMKEVWTA
jgi:disulfide bond formation protein DsbB